MCNFKGFRERPQQYPAFINPEQDAVLKSVVKQSYIKENMEAFAQSHEGNNCNFRK